MSAVASDPLALDNVVAFTLVLDSSPGLSAQWDRIFLSYVSPLLLRLFEAAGSYEKMLLAFVTYAPADTDPTPIVCKQYFSDFKTVTRLMKEEPVKLGIGTTHSGGRTGTAALEGLVGAVELFDLLLEIGHQNDPNCPPSFHICHISATVPDDSELPDWNNSPELDDVTWESLPVVLRERNIHYSSISLRPVPKFAELHAAASSGNPMTPWFNVKSPNTALLAGYPSPLQKGGKRAADATTADRSPEVKRPRLSQPTNTSMQPAARQASQSAATGPPPPQQSASAPTQPPQPQQPLTISSLPPQLQRALEQFRREEAYLVALNKSLNDARAAGDTREEETLMQQINVKGQVLAKNKVVLQSLLKTIQDKARAQNQNQGSDAMALPPSPHMNMSPPNGNRNPPNFGNEGMNMHTGGPSTSNISLPGSQGPDLQPHTHMRSLSDSSQIPSLGPNQMNNAQTLGLAAQRAQMSPGVVSQMQKLIEQTQRSGQARQQHMGSNAGPSQMQGSAAPPANPILGPVWQGCLTWSGTEPHSNHKKEMNVYVIAAPQPGDINHRADTWPQSMTLTPVKQPAVSMQELHAWIQLTKPVLCGLTPNPRHPNTETNKSAFKSLTNLLVSKNIYAMAAWTLPNGIHSNNMLVISIPNNEARLLGAFFPLTGLPDLPQTSQTSFANPSAPTPVPSAPTSYLSNPAIANAIKIENLAKMSLPPGLFDRLRTSGPEDRARLLLGYMQQRKNEEELRRRANLGNPGMHNMGMGMPQHPGQQQRQVIPSGFGMNPQGAGFPNPGGLLGGQGLGPGGGGSLSATNLAQHNIMTGAIQGGIPSMEIMQSFMQRNQENGGGGMGPG